MRCCADVADPPAPSTCRAAAETRCGSRRRLSSARRGCRYVADNRPEWLVADGAIHFEGAKSKKVQEIPSMRLIAETLSYATEIERIV